MLRDRWFGSESSFCAPQAVQVLPEPEEEAPSPVIDLMEALKASVEVAKLARSANGSGSSS